MKTMRHIQMQAYGPAAVLQVAGTEMPQPGPGEVLIEVGAAGVNFSDILRRRNTYFMPTPLPYVPGAEVVGHVAAVGQGVDRLRPGDRVLGILPGGGGYAEYALAPAAYCVPLPPQLDDAAAAAIFVQGTTAHLMLHTLVGDVAGKTLLIHAASGGVGSLLVQLALRAGARVVAAASSADKLAVARDLGAHLLIDYTQPDWAQTLVAANGGERVDVVFEMVGGSIYEQAFGALKPGGTMVVYGAASGERGLVHGEHFVDEGLHLLGFNLAYYVQHRTAAWQAALGELIGLLVSGQVQVRSPHRYPLADAAQAHSDIEQRRTTGKVVLLPGG